MEWFDSVLSSIAWDIANHGGQNWSDCNARSIYVLLLLWFLVKNSLAQRGRKIIYYNRNGRKGEVDSNAYKLEARKYRKLIREAKGHKEKSVGSTVK